MKLHVPMFAAAVLLAGLLTGRPAAAEPILGSSLTYAGGAVTVQSLPSEASFVSELRLYNTSFESIAFIMLNRPEGLTVTFDPGALGIGVGDELIFGIRVLSDANREYFMGSGLRNMDGAIHAAVDNLGGGESIVGFEDLFGGGDRDYNDNRFRFTGGVLGLEPVQSAAVPEPGLLGLLALGFGSVARRRFNRSR